MWIQFWWRSFRFLMVSFIVSIVMSFWPLIPLLISNAVAQAQQPSKGTKRKKVGSEDHHPKVPKPDENDSAGGALSKENPAESGNAYSGSIESEKKLEEQSKALWEIKDELKKHIMTAELREMLEANGQDSAGSEYDLRDRW